MSCVLQCLNFNARAPMAFKKLSRIAETSPLAGCSVSLMLEVANLLPFNREATEQNHC